MAGSGTVAGEYVFADVLPGDYLVVETQATGTANVSDSSTEDGADAANTDTTDDVIPVSVIAAEVDGDNDFLEGAGVDISGTVFNDASDDATISGTGTGESDEPLYVTLLDAAGNVVAVDTVDAMGNYSFEDVPGNATYTIELTETSEAGNEGSMPTGTTDLTGFANSAEGTEGTAGDGLSLIHI